MNVERTEMHDAGQCHGKTSENKSVVTESPLLHRLRSENPTPQKFRKQHKTKKDQDSFLLLLSRMKHRAASEA